MWASMAACKAWLHVKELPELLKWARVPQGCDNNDPKALSYSSLAGISMADKSSLSSQLCAAQAEWVRMNLLCCTASVECGRMIYDSLKLRRPKITFHYRKGNHYTMTTDTKTVIPAVSGRGKHDCRGEFSQHFSKVTYFISISLVEATTFE